jgi:glucuronokinase
LGRLINANFDLRARIYGISEGNIRMIQAARQAGATANFAGSGGAIVGTYEDEHMYQAIISAMQPLGVAVIKPKITP